MSIWMDVFDLAVVFDSIRFFSDGCKALDVLGLDEEWVLVSLESADEVCLGDVDEVCGHRLVLCVVWLHDFLGNSY